MKRKYYLFIIVVCLVSCSNRRYIINDFIHHIIPAFDTIDYKIKDDYLKISHTQYLISKSYLTYYKQLAFSSIRIVEVNNNTYLIEALNNNYGVIYNINIQDNILLIDLYIPDYFIKDNKLILSDKIYRDKYNSLGITVKNDDLIYNIKNIPDKENIINLTKIIKEEELLNYNNIKIKYVYNLYGFD